MVGCLFGCTGYHEPVYLSNEWPSAHILWQRVVECAWMPLAHTAAKREGGNGEFDPHAIPFHHSSSSSDIFAILMPSSRLHTQKHTRTILRPTGVRVGGWHFRRFHYLCVVFSPTVCELQLNFIVFLAKSTPLVRSFECDRQQNISCTNMKPV